MYLTQFLAHRKAFNKYSLLLVCKAKAESKPEVGVRVGSTEPSGEGPACAPAEQEAAGLWSSLSLLAQPQAVLVNCEQVLVWGGASCSWLPRLRGKSACG